MTRANTSTFEVKRLRSIYTEIYRTANDLIWNSHPADFHKASSLDEFKNVMKTWNGPTWNCNFCKYWNY